MPVTERLLTARALRRRLIGEALWRLLTALKPVRLLVAPDTPASIPGYTMRIQRGFDPITTTEADDFAFDFGPRLAVLGLAAETIASVAWNCSVDASSDGTDATPSTRLLGTASITGTVTVQRAGGMLSGVTYLLEAVATTAPSGRVLSLSAGVDCYSP